jgi:indole-3-glycerol phosphate synthase
VYAFNFRLGLSASFFIAGAMMAGYHGSVAEDYLSRLVAQTHRAVRAREAELPLELLLRRVRPSDRYFHSALAQERFHLIGEYKKQCPAQGKLTDNSKQTSLVSALEDYGSALAVHCSEMYGGDVRLLKTMRAICDLPVLCADVLIRPYQVVEARTWGADAVLLMPSLVDQRHLGEMMSQALILNMAAVVLVHDEADLEAALRCRARIIAVSGRNAETFKVDTQRMQRLLANAPHDCIRLAVGGFRSKKQLDDLREEIDGVMIGSALMKAKNPAQLLRRLGFSS